MKLRNRKTGEIIDDGYVRETHDFQFDGQKYVLAVFRGNGHSVPERISGTYNSLAELNEEWEDYEEPDEIWYIDWKGGIRSADLGNTWEDEKEIGNYFETKEEAEKAVEKLKAWKRLKDDGFVFCGKGDCLDTIKFGYGQVGYNNQDFNLLFGGEE